MDYRSRVRKVLEDAENALLTVVSEAASEGDYQAIDLARDTARSLNSLRDPLAKPRASSSSEHGSGGAPLTVKPKRPARKGRSRYPCFSVESDTLIKTGWSKKNKKEYRQRVARDVYTDVVGVLEKLAGSSVSSERILEMVDGLGGDAIPSYQTYIVLAFLRHHDVVKQVTRGTYSVPERIRTSAFETWQSEGGNALE